VTGDNGRCGDGLDVVADNAGRNGDGPGVGNGVGCGVGFGVGCGVGLGVGCGVGLGVSGVGFGVGCGVGLGVGCGVGLGVSGVGNGDGSVIIRVGVVGDGANVSSNVEVVAVGIFVVVDVERAVVLVVIAADVNLANVDGIPPVTTEKNNEKMRVIVISALQTDARAAMSQTTHRHRTRPLLIAARITSITSKSHHTLTETVRASSILAAADLAATKQQCKPTHQPRFTHMLFSDLPATTRL
jgi:hypothetical protein